MENGQHNRIQFNNLSILPNAEMGDPGYQAKYGMVTVESKIINIHGERVELDDDVPEVQDLVIATAAMPHADWRRTRVFCWMTALLHFDKLFQIPLILAHGVSGIAYRDMIEAFMAWYSGNPAEMYVALNRLTGPYKHYYWALIACNIVLVQSLWLKKIRSTPWILWCVAMVVNAGMWLERFVIVVTSLHRDFLPSSWGMYQGTIWDWSTFIGTIGFFCALVFLFIRFLPMISIFEMRTLVPEAESVGGPSTAMGRPEGEV